MRKIVVLIICAILLAGCDRPTHTVIDSGKMVVYHAEERKDLKIGKYEYYVRDGSTKGWVLITDQKFDVGDSIVIKKSEESIKKAE
jgi:uncharacterized protein YcfL